MSTYFAILTQIGEAKLANAIALGQTLKLKNMAVGDGNGNLPLPVRTQKALVHEVRRAGLNQLSIDPANASQIIVEQVLPEEVGGWWIREIGIYDEAGDLCAVANCPPSYKPLMAEGSGRTQVVRVVLIVASTAAIELKIDPAVVLATRKYVDDRDIVVRGYSDAQMAAHLAAADPHPQYSMRTVSTLPKFDASTKLANAAFVQQAQGNMVKAQAIAESRKVTVDDIGSALYFTKPGLTLTISRTDELGIANNTGKCVKFFGYGTETGTLSADAGVVIGYGVGTLQSITIKPGQFITLMATHANVWTVIESSAEMWRNPDFANYFNNVAPTPPKFSDSTRIATAEFVQLSQGNLVRYGEIPASRALAANDIGSALFFTMPGQRVTLPSPESLGIPYNSGKCVKFFGLLYGGELVPNAGVTIGFDVFSVPKVTIKTGQFVTLLATRTNVWQVLDSTAEMGRNADFAGVLGEASWRRLPNGDIEQWGIIKGSALMAPFTPNLAFPMAFPNACRAITVQCMNELSQAGFSGRTTDKTLSRTGAWISNSDGVTAVPDVLSWRAIGN